MNLRVPRVYADTSVFGGLSDDEFARASRAFFDQVRSGRFRLVSSALVDMEMEEAPPEVREFFATLRECMEITPIDERALDLQGAYIDLEIIGPAHHADALHVALATVADCDFVVSWNFQHIVHHEKIPLYNAVNTLMRYRHIGIFSPLEVIEP